MLPDPKWLLMIAMTWVPKIKEIPWLDKLVRGWSGWKSVALVFAVVVFAGFWPEMKALYAAAPFIVQKLLFLLFWAGNAAGLYKLVMTGIDRFGTAMGNGNGKADGGPAAPPK